MTHSSSAGVKAVVAVAPSQGPRVFGRMRGYSLVRALKRRGPRYLPYLIHGVLLPWTLHRVASPDLEVRSADDIARPWASLPRRAPCSALSRQPLATGIGLSLSAIAVTLWRLRQSAIRPFGETERTDSAASYNGRTGSRS